MAIFGMLDFWGVHLHSWCIGILEEVTLFQGPSFLPMLVVRAVKSKINQPLLTKDFGRFAMPRFKSRQGYKSGVSR